MFDQFSYFSANSTEWRFNESVNYGWDLIFFWNFKSLVHVFCDTFFEKTVYLVASAPILKLENKWIFWKPGEVSILILSEMFWCVIVNLMTFFVHLLLKGLFSQNIQWIGSIYPLTWLLAKQTPTKLQEWSFLCFYENFWLVIENPKKFSFAAFLVNDFWKIMAWLVHDSVFSISLFLCISDLTVMAYVDRLMQIFPTWI